MFFHTFVLLFVIFFLESEIIAVIQCTSPFIKSNFLRDALDYIIKFDFDCVFSVTRSHQLRWTTNEGFYLLIIKIKYRYRVDIK